MQSFRTCHLLPHSCSFGTHSVIFSAGGFTSLGAKAPTQIRSSNSSSRGVATAGQTPILRASAQSSAPRFPKHVRFPLPVARFSAGKGLST
jgi:hypothetical protein